MVLLKSYISLVRILLVFWMVYFVLWHTASVDAGEADSLKLLIGSDRLDAEETSLVFARLATLYKNQADSACYFARQGLELAEAAGSKKGLALNYQALGDMAISADSIGRAEHYLQQAVDHARSSNNPTELLEIWLRLGNVQHFRSKLAAALITQQEGLSIASHAKDTLYIARFLNNNAIVEEKADEFQSALAHYKEAGKFFELTGNRLELGYTLHNTGILYRLMQKYDSAYLFFAKAKWEFIELDDPYGLSNVYLNLALMMGEKDSLREAVNLMHWAMVEAERMKNNQEGWNDPVQIAEISLWLGMYYFELNELNRAKKYLWSSYNESIKIDNLELMRSNAEVLACLYDRTGDKDSSLAYYRALKEHNDELQQAKPDKNLVKSFYRYDLEKEKARHDLELSLIESENSRKELILIMVILVALIIAFIAGIIILLFRARLKRQERLRKFMLYGSEKLDQELELRKRELANQVMHMMQRNNLIADLKGTLVEILPTSSEENEAVIRRKLSELDVEEKRVDWKGMETRFTQANSEFMNRLLKRYPQLSANEQKLCAFLQMNMSTKEIASFTQSSANSIRVARYRLRAKLGIPRSQNISSFLSSI